MALYKITFAAETQAMTPVLELLTEAARRGGVSQSFVVELQAEPELREEPAPRRLTAHKHKPKIRRHRGPPGGRAHEVLIKHMQIHGPTVKADLVRALTREGFAPGTYNTAMSVVRKHVTLANDGGLWSIANHATRVAAIR